MTHHHMGKPERYGRTESSGSRVSLDTLFRGRAILGDDKVLNVAKDVGG